MLNYFILKFKYKMVENHSCIYVPPFCLKAFNNLSEKSFSTEWMDFNPSFEQSNSLHMLVRISFLKTKKKCVLCKQNLKIIYSFVPNLFFNHNLGGIKPGGRAMRPLCYCKYVLNANPTLFFVHTYNLRKVFNGSLRLSIEIYHKRGKKSYYILEQTQTNFLIYIWR